MARKWKRLCLLLLALYMATFVPMNAGANGNYVRLSGENRFETAFQVADTMKETLSVDKFQAVIVASGTNFADALSGSYLANVKDAPILLSFNDTYNEKAKTYIRENLAENGTIYILGGTAAVPESMETGLEGYTVKRLAGSNRFETNLLILQEAGVTEGQEVLICTGTNFADSLSASAVGMPILLVWNESGKLTDSQSEYLATLSGNNFCVIGGGNAVGAALEEAVSAYGSVDRLAGGNRFETSVLVAERYFESPETAVLAYAWNYPDGLCGGPLAYAIGCPLILTMTNYERQADDYTDKFGIDHGTVLGGEKLISDESCVMIFEPPVEHEHTWGSWETTQHPTAATEGTARRTCSACGAVETKTLEKLANDCAHDYQKFVQGATCASEGVFVYRCRLCNYTYTEIFAPKSDEHQYSLVSSVPGDCSIGKDGYNTYKCSVCGGSYTETVSGGHNWVYHHTDEVGHYDWYLVCHCGGWSCKVSDGAEDSFDAHYMSVDDPSQHSYYEAKIWVVDTPALDSWTCSNCGAETTCGNPETGEVSERHDWVHHHTDEVGHEEWYVACHCGKWSCKASEFSVSAFNAHVAAVDGWGECSYYEYSQWVVDTPASDYYKCSVCGEVTDQEPICAHSWGEWITIQEPTTTSAGTAERTCIRCSAKETKTLDKLSESHEHSYTERVIIELSCERDGVTVYSCICGDSYTETVKTTGHDFVVDHIVEATCTQRGYTHYVCTICGTFTDRDDTLPLGHEYDWEFSADGRHKGICGNCGETKNTDPDESISGEEALEYINAYRAEEGLEPYTYYWEAQEIANIRAADLVVSWSHNRPDGSPFISLIWDTAYDLNEECITGAFYRDVKSAVDAWMASTTGHRECLMSPVNTHVVLAYNEGGWVLLAG